MTEAAAVQLQRVAQVLTSLQGKFEGFLGCCSCGFFVYVFYFLISGIKLGLVLVTQTLCH